MVAWLQGVLAAVPRRNAPLRGCARHPDPAASHHFLASFGWLALTSLFIGAGVAQAATYVYDSNGRLRAVTDSTGASASYVYDAMGNLLQVNSVSADQLAIFAFSPDHGAVGTTVTISGQNFSATAANDIVKFNGTTATVTIASTTSLTTKVPIGALSGKITVTVGAKTATSDDVFTVDDTGLAPVITSFSPTIGASGTSVTVVGEHFDPTADQTTVAIGGWKSNPSSISDTQVVFPVAAGMGSGKVSVTTPFGMDVSSSDFFVTPPGISAANVAIKKRIAVGGSTGAMTIPAGKYAAILFDASSGAWLSFQGSAITTSANSINYWIYDVHNQLVVNGTVSASRPSIHPPQLGPPGTYSIWIEPDTASATLTLALETDKVLAINGASITLNTTAVNQSKRLVFSDAAAENLGLGLSQLVGSSVDEINVLDPNLTDIVSIDCDQSTGSCGSEMQTLVSGTYQVLIDSGPFNSTLGCVVTLSRDLMDTLALNSTISTTISRYGQTERLSFSATAGQTLALEAYSVSTEPTGQDVKYYVYMPDGEFFVSGSAAGAIGYTLLNLPNLPQTGIYMVWVVPRNGAKLSGQLELVTGVTRTLTVNGSPENVNTALPGEYAYFTFTTSTNEDVGLGLNGLSESNGGDNIFASIYDANNVYLRGLSCYLSKTTCGTDLKNLAAGTYTVVVSPSGSVTYATMSFTVTLSQDLTGALPLNVPTATTIARYGQTETLSFSATAGQTVALEASSLVTTPSNNNISYYVITPDGESYTSFNTSSGYALENLANLPQTGTYEVYTVPDNGAQMSGQLEARSPTTLVVDGPPQNFATTMPQEGVYLGFVATPGENVGLGLSAMTMSGDGYGYIWVSVYDSNNVRVGFTDSGCYVPNGTCGLDMQNLAAGNYEVIVQPSNGSESAMSFTVTLSNDLAATLPMDSPTATTIPRYGQTETLTFSAAAGQTVALRASNLATTPTGDDVYYYVYTPDGEQYASFYTANHATKNLPNLPTGGTYKAYVVPWFGAGLTGQLQLASGVTGALTMNGPSQSFSTTMPGEDVYLSFTNPTLQNVTLALSAMSSPGGDDHIDLDVYDGNNSLVAAASCYVSDSACTPDLQNLAPGNYQVKVAPDSSSGTLGFTAILTSP